MDEPLEYIGVDFSWEELDEIGRTNQKIHRRIMEALLAPRATWRYRKPRLIVDNTEP